MGKKCERCIAKFLGLDLELCKNAKDLETALNLFEQNIQSRQSVETAFGNAVSTFGYQIKSISFYETHVRIDVYMNDRKCRKNDKFVREGDAAFFLVKDGKVYTDIEYEALCKAQEAEYERQEKAKANKERIVQYESNKD